MVQTVEQKNIAPYEEVGEIISDESSPTFETFRFKAFHNKSSSPGTIVAVQISTSKFLIGRVSKSHEHNPHYEAHQLSVKHALQVEPEHPGEDLSFTIYRVYEVEILDEVHLINGIPEVRPAQTMPKAGSKVIIPPQEFVYSFLGLQKESLGGLKIGNLASSLNEEGEIPIILKKDVIQRHIFIGGTTGGGKSYSAKVLAEEIHKQNIPIIFFDTQYEFVPLVEKLKGNILIPGQNYKVSLSSLTPDELEGLVPTITNDLHKQILTSAFLRIQERKASFSGEDLISEIDTVATELSGTGKQAETTKYYVKNRTGYHLRQYDFIGNDFDWKELIKPSSLININCRGVNRQRLQLILAATLRELQTLRKSKKILPYIVFIDEAHLFVPQDEDSACKQIIREGVRIGRHYGTSFVLITQSPIDIDKKAIRQCNTRLLFALEPDQLIALQGVKADATEEMISRLPKSPIGTCILSGTYETVKHAVPVKIRKLETESSDGGETPDIFSEVAEYGKRTTQ